MNEAYEKLKAKGFDMGWYERHKRNNPDATAPAALNSDHCSCLSIYLLDVSGKLHTTNSEGAAYMWVRTVATKPKEKIYLCACCNIKFKTYKEASEHYAKKEDDQSPNDQA
jgi:hypothetical protein